MTVAFPPDFPPPFARTRHGKTVHPLICKSMAMLEVARRVERAAQADSPVLIWGEQGSGKKRVAEAIHRRSRRADGPLAMVATDKSQGWAIEDELFGTARQPGRLAAAAGGTLLIHEVAGLPLTTQAKLLDAAEGRGDSELRGGDGQPVDFRLMATTRRELSESVKRGAVREDLYYRLTVVTIRVPSLRERIDDIPCLAQQMLGELCTARGRPAVAIGPAMMRYLVDRPWPGNGRELRDCLEAMLAEQDPEAVEMGPLPPSWMGHAGDPGPAGRQERIDTLAELERNAVMRALKVHHGNRTQAAKTLGISVRTLQRKLRHWGE